MANYFYVCESCGAHLDPGEKCSCEASNTDDVGDGTADVKDKKDKKEEVRSDDPNFPHLA